MPGLSNDTLAKKAEDALKAGLTEGGIKDAAIKHEVVKGTRYVRLSVTSKKLGRLGHAERQNVVWRILQTALGAAACTRISMVLTLTPDEQKGR
jgi:hypothetical protein